MNPEDLASAYTFDLPEELIAQHPAPVRDASRLMVVRASGIEHKIFRDLPSVLRSDDLLVLNETRVIAARLFGTREGTGGAVEVLLLHPADAARYDPNANVWTALVRPAKRLRHGAAIAFGDLGVARVTGELDEGIRTLHFDVGMPFETFLERAGRLPLPPYIHNDSEEAQARYQTVFAREPGSVAAPTASLHFTPEVLDEIRKRGVEIVRLTLDVGLGTFRPMKGARLDEHKMHAETYVIPPAAADAIARAKHEGRRIVAAGTTVVRALEGSAQSYGAVRAGEGATSIFIRPGFTFRVVDAMITNFHLPQSTLLVLVSAFAGRERMLHAYREAVAHSYRFFSFGDAMFLEPAPRTRT
ncbi:MAG: tRNA preQ1(34) S-adenosylmethionine ribosyltransferase-isomerase QueA [Candidatus Eremiobacteraeota bacterium]|nr:tRNA preQ1(34) S-adenosylmethionine ribosyltransferase-isomerase QueA [Candidatus Eremiobacteraeota bacterium]